MLGSAWGEGLQPGFQGLPQPLADECAEVIHQGIIGVKDQPLPLALAAHQPRLAQLAELPADVRLGKAGALHQRLHVAG